MGKTLKVVEFDLKVGNDDHVLDVYAVFKEEKRGDVLAIYSDRMDDNKDVLHYGSVHMKDKTIVFIDIKNKEEIIKEFTWKLINDQENDGFEVFDISEYEKAEIVSSNELVLKSEVIKQLFEKTIPKKVEASPKKKKKMKSSSKILLTGISLSLFVVIAFLIINIDLLLGTSIKYNCYNSYLDTEVGSTKEEIHNLTFDLNNNLTSRSIITKYTFSTLEEYTEYVNLGSYYKQEPIYYNSSFRYEKDASTLSFNIIEEVLLDYNYDGKTDKVELLEEMIHNNYQCIDVSE